jgi:hypothetical protein
MSTGTVPGLHDSKVGFGPINSAKRFGLLQAESSHMEVTTRGPQLVQHLVEYFRNLVLLS